MLRNLGAPAPNLSLDFTPKSLSVLTSTATRYTAVKVVSSDSWNGVQKPLKPVVSCELYQNVGIIRSWCKREIRLTIWENSEIPVVYIIYSVFLYTSQLVQDIFHQPYKLIKHWQGFFSTSMLHIFVECYYDKDNYPYVWVHPHHTKESNLNLPETHVKLKHRRWRGFPNIKGLLMNVPQGGLPLINGLGVAPSQ